MKLLAVLLILVLFSLTGLVSASFIDSFDWPFSSTNHQISHSFKPNYELLSIESQINANDALFQALQATGSSSSSTGKNNAGFEESSSLPTPILESSSISQALSSSVFELSSTGPAQFITSLSSEPFFETSSITAATSTSFVYSSSTAPAPYISSSSSTIHYETSSSSLVASSTGTAPSCPSVLEIVNVIPEQVNITECVSGIVDLEQLSLHTSAKDTSALGKISLSLSSSDGSTMTFNNITGVEFTEGAPSGTSDVVISGSFDALNNALDYLLLIEPKNQTYIHNSDNNNNGTIVYQIAWSIYAAESVVPVFNSASGVVYVGVTVNDHFSPELIIPYGQCDFSMNETSTVQLDGSYLNPYIFGNQEKIVTVRIQVYGAFLQLLTADDIKFIKVAKDELIFSGTVEKIDAALRKFSFTTDTCGSSQHSTGYTISILGHHLNETHGACGPITEQHCHIINQAIGEQPQLEQLGDSVSEPLDMPAGTVFARVKLVPAQQVANEAQFLDQCNQDVAESLKIPVKRINFYKVQPVEGATQLYFALFPSSNGQSKIAVSKTATDQTPQQLFEALRDGTASLDSTVIMASADLSTFEEQCSDGNYKSSCGLSSAKSNSITTHSSIWDKNTWLMPVIIAVGGALLLFLAIMFFCIYKRQTEEVPQQTDAAAVQTDLTGIAAKQYHYRKPENVTRIESSTSMPTTSESFSHVTIMADRSVDPSRMSIEEQQMNVEPIIVHNEEEASQIAKNQLRSQFPHNKLNQQQIGGTRHFYYMDDSKQEKSISSISAQNAVITSSSNYHFKFNSVEREDSMNSQISLPIVTLHSDQRSEC